jgi:hypothetical protein
MKLFFYPLFLVISLCISCVDKFDAPCRDQVVALKYTFSEVEVGAIPYSAKDTLVFATEVGDTLRLMTSLYLDSVTMNIANSPNNPDCPNDYESHQVLQSTVKDSVSLFFISYHASQLTGICRFAYGAESIEIPLSAIGSTDSSYIDSVLLGNTVYYNVNLFMNGLGTAFYIHPKLGLLRFSKDSKYYSLQKFNSKTWK